jgi:hypothetical protein
MTDSQNGVRAPDDLTILYSVAGYRAGVERELLLVVLPLLGRTLLDVRAGVHDDQHIVADGLENCAGAGVLAVAHIAASIAAGRPAVPTAEPPTSEQLRVLKADCDVLGQRFHPPANRAEAAKWVRRARGHDVFEPRRVARQLWEAAHAGCLAEDAA